MMLRKFWIFVALICCAAAYAHAAENDQQTEEAFPIPDRYQLVNDYLDVLDMSKRLEISKKLQALEKRNGTQIVFLSVPSVGADGPYPYAVKVAEKWDIGNNGQGNGVLFLAAQGYGPVILTGPGIAGALPDAKLAQIVREFIEPRWKKEEFSEGIEGAIDAMILAAQGEDTKAASYEYQAAQVAPNQPKYLLIGALVLLGAGYAAVLFWLRSRKKKHIGKKHIGVFIILACAIYFAFAWKTDLEKLMLPVKTHVESQAGNRFVAVDPAKLPITPKDLAEPGLTTVVYFHDDTCEACMQLDRNLADFLRVRPDVAVRKIPISKGTNAYSEAIRDYQTRIYKAPFILIFGGNGKLIAADDRTDSTGEDLLKRWMALELVQAAYRK